MKDQLGVSPSKGNQGTTRSKEKYGFDLGGNRTHDLRIRSTVTLPTELRGRTEESLGRFRWSGTIIVFIVLRGTTFICILSFSSPRFTS